MTMTFNIEITASKALAFFVLAAGCSGGVYFRDASLVSNGIMVSAMLMGAKIGANALINKQSQQITKIGGTK